MSTSHVVQPHNFSPIVHASTPVIILANWQDSGDCLLDHRPDQRLAGVYIEAEDILLQQWQVKLHINMYTCSPKSAKALPYYYSTYIKSSWVLQIYVYLLSKTVCITSLQRKIYTVIATLSPRCLYNPKKMSKSIAIQVQYFPAIP